MEECPRRAKTLEERPLWSRKCVSKMVSTSSYSQCRFNVCQKFTGSRRTANWPPRIRLQNSQVKYNNGGETILYDKMKISLAGPSGTARHSHRGNNHNHSPARY